MFLGCALLQCHFTIDAVLDVLYLLAEVGDGRNDPIEFGIAFTGNMMTKLLVESQELFLTLPVEGGGVEDRRFLATAGLDQLRFFHSEYNRQQWARGEIDASGLCVGLHVLPHQPHPHVLRGLGDGQTGFVGQDALVAYGRQLHLHSSVVLKNGRQFQDTVSGLSSSIQQLINNLSLQLCFLCVILPIHPISITRQKIADLIAFLSTIAVPLRDFLIRIYNPIVLIMMANLQLGHPQRNSLLLNMPLHDIVHYLLVRLPLTHLHPPDMFMWTLG